MVRAINIGGVLLAGAVALWTVAPAAAGGGAKASEQGTGTQQDEALRQGAAGDVPVTTGGQQGQGNQGTGNAADMQGQQGQAAQQGAQADPAQLVEPWEIGQSPTQFYNQDVRVKADIDRVYGSNAFTLKKRAEQIGPDILVLVPELKQTQNDGPVTIQGTVRPFVTVDLERDYQWFHSSSVQPDLLVRFKEWPVIVADSVETADGQELVKQQATTGSGPAAGDAPMQQGQQGTQGQLGTQGQIMPEGHQGHGAMEHQRPLQGSGAGNAPAAGDAPTADEDDLGLDDQGGFDDHPEGYDDPEAGFGNIGTQGADDLGQP